MSRNRREERSTFLYPEAERAVAVMRTEEQFSFQETDRTLVSYEIEDDDSDDFDLLT